MPKNKFQIVFTGLAIAMIVLSACQKMNKPALGDYLKDVNPPGGALKFYAAFDGTTTNPLMNGVDSIRANFPSDNPLASTDGVSGKGIQGAAKKFIKYPSFNEWSTSSSFSVSVWFKKNGQTTNNLGGNGPEYIFSLRAAEGSYHWSNAVMFLFLEGNNTACAVKTMCVSPSVASNPNSSPSDNWFTWENSQTIPGLLNDQWHHLVIVYDASNSTMKLYIDGVANANIKSWGGHGAIRLANTKIGEYRVGRGPRNDDEGDGEGGWLQSSFKGKMDQLRFYGTALSAAEVTNLFNSKK
ncbi:LamG domain-containing protein [Lacibacter sp.]|jgi:hypothetical protein|uniref:LamG domain-containing protein n=1 Tax=Lacibacter sp. TaxID=1915409 RepID=UPI002B4B36D1|nr:LamG domain-containing protein [Lacibacter sp.]HLP35825.1 LamG domain-containing protein [Lacibacter sp.]